MTFDLRRTIYQVTSQTRRICFDLRRNGHCGPVISSVANLSIDIYREGLEHEDEVIITYPFFDRTEDGRLCILLDQKLIDECPGRYIAYLMYGCEQFDFLRFEIGCRPVVAAAPELTSSADEDCLPQLGQLSETQNIIEPEQCCEEEICAAPETCCPERRCKRIVELHPKESNDDA